MNRAVVAALALAAIASPAIAEKRPQGAMTDKETLTIYEGQAFQGEYLEIVKDMPSVTYEFTIGSVGVYPGEKWELCEGTRYRGVCNIFTGNETNLGRIKIQSVRRVKPAVPAPATP